ncbi:hypothetical protein MRY87_01390 [bacterium]|nr:hypothetical protein [bacterium]
MPRQTEIAEGVAMDYALKKITELPLTELWNDDGPIISEPQRELVASEIKELLRAGTVQFVIARCGEKPQWIEGKDTFDFWKNEVQPRLSETNEAQPEEFPGEYCYSATEWRALGDIPLIVLEVFH